MNRTLTLKRILTVALIYPVSIFVQLSSRHESEEVVRDGLHSGTVTNQVLSSLISCKTLVSTVLTT